MTVIIMKKQPRIFNGEVFCWCESAAALTNRRLEGTDNYQCGLNGHQLSEI